MRITSEHFGKKMVLTGRFGPGQYFIPASLAIKDQRVNGASYYPDQGVLADWWSNEDTWDYYKESAATKGFCLTREHINKKVRLPIWDGRTNILYFIPFSHGPADRPVAGITHYTDGSYKDDQWYNQSGWTFYEEPKAANTGVEQKASSGPDPAITVQTHIAIDYAPKDYSLLEAVRSGRRFFNALNAEDTSEDRFVWVNPNDDVLYWSVGGDPFAMCEFNLASRYILEPEPSKPVVITEEIFDAAWGEAATEQQNTDRPFRECLKEALGIVD